MIEVTILCWIQFYNVLKPAAYVATAILVPFVILFIWFAFIFYRKLVAHTYETRKSGIQELERFDGTNTAARIWEVIEAKIAARR